MFRTIVWATDGSALADGALEHVLELARVHHSRVVAVHANELMQGRAAGQPVLADEPELETRIGEQVKELRSAGFDARLEIRTGSRHAATLIAKAAEDVDADLIVVGTHGRGGFRSAFLGSVARALCHTSGRPVLVVPPPKAAKRPAPAEKQAAVV